MEVKEEMNKDVMFNFEFGKIKDNSVKISMNGLAFKDVTGSYVTYDAKTNKLTDVSSLVFNMDFLYMMPVAIKDVKVNDISEKIISDFPEQVDSYDLRNTQKNLIKVLGE